jgi:hypothetical protein
MHKLTLDFIEGDKTETREVAIGNFVIAGWTGRDAQAVEKHIAELETLGVARPATTPIFYRAAASRLNTDAAIEVLGNESSGEVEFVLLRDEKKIWVGVGSDHTDRKVESYNVSVSKQVCDKPLCATFWAYDDIADHWDDLILRSYISEDGVERLYQEGRVSAMLHPDDLIARQGGLPEGTLMFCGTHSVIGEFGTKAQHFDLELEDKVKNRILSHRYEIVTLPILG